MLLVLSLDQSDTRETLQEGRHEFNFDFELPIEYVSLGFFYKLIVV